MQFRFERRRSIQAAARLLELNGGTMNYMVLIKLLYLADRQSLVETGLPITGDRLVAMPHGPALSATLNCVKDRDVCGPEWASLISEPQDFEVRLSGSAGRSELSDYDLDVLLCVYQQFGHMSQWDLSDYTHTLGEWEDPRGSSVTIDPATILRNHGYTDETINDLSAMARESAYLATLGATA